MAVTETDLIDGGGQPSVGDTSADQWLRPKRIALVCDWFLPRVGGIERHVGALAGRLADLGHHVTVVTPMKGACLPDPRIELHRMPARLLAWAEILWAPTAFRRLGRTLAAGRFDVVHAHGSILTPTAFAALYHAQRLGVAAVSTTHSVIGAWWRLFAGLDRGWSWSRWPVVFSGVSTRVAREIGAMGPSPVVVLPNAVDPSTWRMSCRAPREVISIACVMRLVSRKRGDVLLRALRAVRDHLPETQKIRLRFVGEGPARRRLERLAAAMGLGAMVEFLGALPPQKVRNILAASHFFVLPSILEAFGIAALEARAAGLPVVAMASSGVSEFIVHGQDGLLATDDDELARHLVRLCRDQALRERIADHNRRTGVTFTWGGVLPAHLSAYARAHQIAAQGKALRTIAQTTPEPCR